MCSEVSHRRINSIWFTILAVLITSLIVGATIYIWKDRALLAEKHRSQEAQQALQEQITRLQSDLLRLRSSDAETEISESANYLKVYGMDPNSYAVDVDFYVAVSEKAPLVDKLNVLTSKLSEFKFNDYPIYVNSIQNRSGKKITIIELTDPRNNQIDTQSSWNDFFQGSTGGLATRHTLVDTFLQRDYKGEWVDGIEFRWNGNPFELMDHIDLTGTIYR